MVPKAPAKEKSRQSFKDSQRRPKSIASSIWQKPKSKISSNQAHLIANARTFAFETYSPRLRLQKQPESVASSHLQSMDTSALEALASMARVLRALAFERHPIVDRPVCCLEPDGDAVISDEADIRKIGKASGREK